MTEVFRSAAYDYLAVGIPVFPVGFPPDGRKQPLIRNYSKVGLKGAHALIQKFPDAPGVGLMCGARNGIVEVDIDDPSDQLLDEVLDIFGQTPLQIATASGNRKLWYSWNGERRLIRPFTGFPIDILGDGMTVAPPSLIQGKGSYEFINGCLDALKNLPHLNPERLPVVARQASTVPRKSSPTRGSRKDWLIRELLRAVRSCDSIDDLLDVALTLNQECRDHIGEPDPLSDCEVQGAVAWAYEKEKAGSNWVGTEARAVNTTTETLVYASNPRLYWFRDFVRQNHAARKSPFALDQEALANIMGCNPRTVRRVIEDFLQTGELIRVKQGGGRGNPHLYRLDKGSQKYT